MSAGVAAVDRYRRQRWRPEGVLSFLHRKELTHNCGIRRACAVQADRQAGRRGDRQTGIQDARDSAARLLGMEASWLHGRFIPLTDALSPESALPRCREARRLRLWSSVFGAELAWLVRRAVPCVPCAERYPRWPRPSRSGRIRPSNNAAARSSTGRVVWTAAPPAHKFCGCRRMRH